MDFLQEITKPYLRIDLPSLQVGEKVKIITKTSVFEGIITSLKRPKKISCSFTVLGKSKKLAIKQNFFYHSSSIVKIEKMGTINQKVCQAKLYFLERELAAKKASE